MIDAKIVADSIGASGVRLTTFVLTYPRFVHAEFLTHRMFSRNASSSRAIPVKKQIQMVIDNPVIPLAFTRNQKGMQGGEALSGDEHQAAVVEWLKGRDRAVLTAKELAELEVHKQYANRVLEPWAHITVVCSATDFNNFFALRCHPAAQPEINVLATLMWEAYNASVPKIIHANYHHLPFMSESDIVDTRDWAKAHSESTAFTLLKRSAARCARVSYLNHDGTPSTVEQDLELYQRLMGQLPIHASPAEHQAISVRDPNYQSGNFRGWIQYRKTISNENIVKFEGPVT